MKKIFAVWLASVFIMSGLAVMVNTSGNKSFTKDVASGSEEEEFAVGGPLNTPFVPKTRRVEESGAEVPKTVRASLFTPAGGGPNSIEVCGAPNISPITEGDSMGGSWLDSFYLPRENEWTMNVTISDGDVKLSKGSKSGYIISKRIPLPSGRYWDTFSVSKTEPQNTWINVSIIDASTNKTLAGFENRAERNINISNITAGAIRLRANFAGNGTATPLLHSWGVEWRAKRAWRDSFVGDGKLAESENATVGEGAAKIARTDAQELAQEPGMVALWHFNEGKGTMVNDSSGNANHGTLFNGPSWTTGRFGSGLEFDGVDDYVETLTQININGSIEGAITYELWANACTVQQGTTPAMVGVQNWLDGGVSIGVVDYGANLSFGWFDGVSVDGLAIQSSGYMGSWHHYAFVLSTAGRYARIYVDGNPVIEKTTGYFAFVLKNEFIQIGHSWGCHHFNGTIDEVAIYNRALSPEEIKNHYLGSHYSSASIISETINPPNLGKWQQFKANATFGNISREYPPRFNTSAWWKFNEGDGASAGDESPYGNNGKIYGNTKLLMHFNEGDGDAVRDESPYGNNGKVYGNTRLLMHFDEGSGNIVHDSSPYGNDGTWFGFPTANWTADKSGSPGKALQFDGRDDYVEVPDNPSLNLATSLSVEAWIKIGILDGKMRQILAHEQYGPYDKGYGLRINQNRIEASLGNGAWNTINWPNTPSVGVWYHVASAWDGSTFKLYVNGCEVNSKSVPGSAAYATKLWIGVRNFGGLREFFSGSIDEVAIYSKALSATEIREHYNAGKAKFTDWVPGRFGSALEFDGVDDYVELGNPASLSSFTQITIEAWYNQKVDDSGTIISKHWAQATLAHRRDTGDGARFALRIGGVDREIVQGFAQPKNEWHHYAGTYDGNVMRLYVDGAVKAQLTVSGAVDVGTSNWWLAKNNYGGINAGIIDEVAIYSKALNETEIREHYLAGKAKFTDWVSGKFGTALQFDGVDDYVEISPSPSLDIANAITIQAWIKTNAVTGQKIVGKGINDYNLFISASGSIGFQIYNGGYVTCFGGSGYNDNSWHYITGTYDGTDLKVYGDGKLLNIVNSPGSIRKGWSTPRVTIGASPFDFSEKFNGTIDSVRIFNRALTAEEILDDYCARTNITYSILNAANASVIQTFSASPGAVEYNISNIRVPAIKLVANLTTSESFYTPVLYSWGVSWLARPSAPQNLRAVPGNGQVTLSWAAPADDGGSPITNYKIYWGTSSSVYPNNKTIGNVTTDTVAGLTNGVRYFFAVSALSAAGEGEKAVELSETPRTVPASPRNLRAVEGNASVVLTWSAPENDGGAPVTSYKIYRNGSLLIKLGNVTAYVDGGLTNGVTYRYKIAAVNAAGEGANSSELSARPRTVPSAPQNLQSVPGVRQVRLMWSAPASSGGAEITGYRISWGTSSGLYAWNHTVGNTTSDTITGLDNDATYYFVVVALNEAGEGTKSNEAIERTYGFPSEPQTVQASVSERGMVILTWRAPSTDGRTPVTHYRIYRGNSSGGEKFLVELNATSTAFEDSNVTAGTKYYYQVTAVNAVGESGRSAEVVAMLPAIRGDGAEEKSLAEQLLPYLVAIAIILTALGAAGGYIKMRKGRKTLREYMNRIDETYRLYRWNPQAFEQKLDEFRAELEGLLEKGAMPEPQYEVLSTRCEKYLKKLGVATEPRTRVWVAPSQPARPVTPPVEGPSTMIRQTGPTDFQRECGRCKNRFTFADTKIICACGNNYHLQCANALGKCPKCGERISTYVVVKEALKTAVDELFLIYSDGRLLKHMTRRLKPDMDADILAGMFTAVQAFVKDSFREEGALDELKFGDLRAYVSRGRFINLVAVIAGEDRDKIKTQLDAAVQDIEQKYYNILKDWDGRVDSLAPITKSLRDLLDGKYKP